MDGTESLSPPAARKSSPLPSHPPPPGGRDQPGEGKGGKEEPVDKAANLMAARGSVFVRDEAPSNFHGVAPTTLDSVAPGDL